MAVIFSMTAMPLVLLTGAAIDYSRASDLQSRLQAATDAATLLACRSSATTPSDVQTAIATTVPNYMKGSVTVTVDPPTVSANPRGITAQTHASYPTAFMKIVRIDTMAVAASSSCATGNVGYEVALVLDTTGSMSNSAGSQTKLAAMQSAATSFVNTMFTDFGASKVKMSLVPFAASVKVDPTTYAPGGTPTASWFDLSGMSSAHWQNVVNPAASGFSTRFGVFSKLKAANSAWGWAGCLEALPYPYNTKDTTPSSATPDTRYVPLFAPDEVSNWLFIFDTNANNNSYMDDGSGSGGSCNSYDANQSTRLGQACKYNAIQNKRTSQPGPNWGCTSRALTRLTSVQATLTSEISQLQASGNTNIAEGLHWGWRTISNTGVFNDATDYGSAATKVIILMTDGVNTWNAAPTTAVTLSEYSAYGYFKNADGSTTTNRLPSGYSNLLTSIDSRNAMDQVTRETCANVKAKGIVIYTVAFSTPNDLIDASGQTLLQSCASDSAHFFLASDTASLNASFAAIAQGIGQLRITK